MKKLYPETIRLLISILAIVSAVHPTEFGEREEFDLPLANLRLKNKDSDTPLKEVRVSFERHDDYYIIGPGNDTKAELSRHGYKKTVYREPLEHADIITEFEVEILNRVVESLIETLDILQEIIQKRQWSKARFLDSYFPKFLNNYYYLVCAAKCSEETLPGIAKIPDNAYEVSRSSIKTDCRISKWKSSKKHLIKLAISTKELKYQLEKWQDECLDNRRRKKRMDYSEEVSVAYGRFIRMYFNLTE